MRCSICGQTLGMGTITYTVFGAAGFYTLNLCIPCMRRLIGSSTMNRVHDAAIKLGWRQLPLPDVPA